MYSQRRFEMALSVWTRAYWNSFVLWNARDEGSLPYRPLDEIEEIQTRRLRGMMRHVFENVPYYRRTMEEIGLTPSNFRSAVDLALLPILDSTKFLSNSDQFQARNIPARRTLKIQSSGTTGRPKTLFYDHPALFKSMAHGHRQRLAIRPFTGQVYGYREMIVTRSGGVVDQLRDFYAARMWIPSTVELHRHTLRPSAAGAKDQISRVRKFRPDVIRGYGSYIGHIFRYAHERGLSFPRPKVVVYAADGMPPPDRALIEGHFGVPVLSNYQAVEALRLAFQCEQGRGFHVCTDDVAYRVVDEQGIDVAPGEEGEIIISNLTNRATVLLNYRLGDRVTVGGSDCPCGRMLPLIRQIRGRSDDLIFLPGGRFIHSGEVLDSLQQVPGVFQIQIVQESLDSLLIRAVAAGTSRDEQTRDRLVKTLLDQLTGAAGSVEVEVDFVTSLPVQPSGKVKAVISKCR